MLTDTYLITGSFPREESLFLQRLENCIQNNISLIQLRVKNLSNNEYIKLAEKAIKLCRNYKVKLLLNCEIAAAQMLNADGIHLTSQQLLQQTQRPLGSYQLVTASCHNAQELRHAQKIGVDFVTLSPVLPTRSHPEAVPLGWNGFSELAALVKLPVYALGGVGKDELTIAKKHGAIGIAAISALWG